jgi:hypothetical protein
MVLQQIFLRIKIPLLSRNVQLIESLLEICMGGVKHLSTGLAGDYAYRCS